MSTSALPKVAVYYTKVMLTRTFPRNMGERQQPLQGLRELLQRDLLVGDITAVYSGQVGPSVQPPVHQRYARGPHFDRTSGGADLSFTYNMRVRQGRFRQACRIFEEHVSRGDLEHFKL